MICSFFKKRSFIILSALFFLFPMLAGATDTTYNFLFDTGWTSPLQTTIYPIGTPIHVSGPWKLPPDWRGNIYVYQDGVQMTGAYIVTGPSGTQNGSGSIIPISNKGGGAEIKGTFDINIGPQTSGPHQIYVSFTGGTTCAINAIPPVVSPSCAIDTIDPNINFMSSKGWLLSGGVAQPTYTVGPPAFAVMSVTPDPTLDFGSVSAQTDRSFTIQNTGGEILSGRVTGVTAPFYCIPSCLYSVPPGSSLPVTIRFAPTGAPQSYSAPVSLSCVGATKSCQPLSSYSRTIKANFTSGAQPVQVSLCATPPCTVSFGNVNTLVAYTKSVTVTNTGGGKLDGVVTFSSSEYTCVGPCDYHLFGGESVVIQIQFIPVSAVPVTRNDTATFTGGTSKTLSMTSVVNDKPILMVYNHTPTDPIYTASWGNVTSNNCVNWGFPVYNVGAGILTNSGLPVTGSPLAISITSTPKTPGFSCTSGCTYTGLTASSLVHWITFRYCATGAYDDGLLHETTAEFKNAQGASVFLKFSAKSDNQPYANFWGNSNGNTGYFLYQGSRPLLNYGNVLLNTTKTLSITMGNTGAGTLTGTISAPSDPAFQCASAKMSPSGTVVSCSAPYSLPNDGTTITLTYAFKPTVQKNYEATVDLGYGGNVLTLRGRGMVPSFEFETDLNPSQTYTVGLAAGSAAGVTSFQSSNDADNLYYKVFHTLAPPPYVDLYVNGDQDSGSGYNIYSVPGADYLIESRTDSGSTYGNIERYVGTGGGWGWNYVKDATYADVGATEKDFTLSRADLGYPRYVNALVNLEKLAGGSSHSASIVHTFSQSLLPFNSAVNAFDFGSTLYGSASQNKQLRFIAIDRAHVTDVSYSININALTTPDFVCVSSCSGVLPYGAYKNGVYKDKVACRSSIFGDPIPGVDKHCDYRPVGSSVAWTYCADEGGTCNFVGTMEVRYGDDGLSSSAYALPVIEFRPRAVGDYKEPITVSYNLGDGAGARSFTFYAHGNSNLTGVGFNVPLIRLVPDLFLDMQIAAQGARRDKDVTIYNDGSQPLNVVRIWASAMGNPLAPTVHFACLADAYTAPDNCNPTIAAGASRVIKVTFQPQTGSGDLYADLNFTSDAFNAPTTPIQLHGVATVASIVTILLQGSDFGRVTVNKTKTQDVLVQNTGSGDFGTGWFTFTGPFTCIASEYGMDASGNCKYKLNAGGSTTITVEFAPKTMGPQVGSMELSGLAGVALPPLTGVGISPFIKFIER